MKFLPLIIILLWAGLMASCGGDRRVDDVLTSADSLVFTAPDSAVRLLDSLTLGRASSAQLDRHALLTAKAREKAGIIVRDDTPDSMLSRSIDALGVAADHFRGRGDSLEVQTLFYRGVLLGYRGDYSESLVSLMEAADRAADTGDNFYRAMSYREQATVYVNLYSYDQAASLSQKAADAFILADRPIYAAWERVYLPMYLAYSGNVDEAYEMIDELSTDSLIMSNRPLLREFYNGAVNVCFEKGLMNKAADYFDEYVSLGGSPSSKLLSQMAFVKLRQNDPDNALSMYRQAVSLAKTKTDSIAASLFMSKYSADVNLPQDAYDLYVKAQNDHIRTANRLISHPYTVIVANHYRNANAQNLLKRKSAEEHVLILASAFIFIVGLFIVYVIIYRKNMRARNLESQILLNDFQKLAQKNAELLEMQNGNSTDPGIYSLPGQLMNAFCEARYLMPSAADSRSKFEKRVSGFIDSIDKSESMSQLEHFVDSTNDNLMSRFRILYPDLPPNYYKIALLTFAGFSATSIICIVKIKEGSYRNIRSKIHARISSTNAEDRVRFISYFQNLRT